MFFAPPGLSRSVFGSQGALRGLLGTSCGVLKPCGVLQWFQGRPEQRHNRDGNSQKPIMITMLEYQCKPANSRALRGKGVGPKRAFKVLKSSLIFRKKARRVLTQCPKAAPERISIGGKWRQAPRLLQEKPNSGPPPPIPCLCCLPACCSAGLHESAQDRLLPCGGVWRDLAGVAVNVLVDVEVVGGVVELSEVAWHMHITSCIMDS